VAAQREKVKVVAEKLCCLFPMLCDIRPYMRCVAGRVSFSDPDGDQEFMRQTSPRLTSLRKDSAKRNYRRLFKMIRSYFKSIQGTGHCKDRLIGFGFSQQINVVSIQCTLI